MQARQVGLLYGNMGAFNAQIRFLVLLGNSQTYTIGLITCLCMSRRLDNYRIERYKTQRISNEALSYSYTLLIRDGLNTQRHVCVLIKDVT
jgi:hypothetical protein